MRSGRCLLAGASLDFGDQLQAAIGKDVITILPIPKFSGFAKARCVEDLHTAILFTPDGLAEGPEDAVSQIRDEDPRIVVIAMLTRRNDSLEQLLLRQGCDDVMTAPICAETLAERLLLRVRQRGWSIGSREVVQIYDTRVDLGQLKVYRSGSVKPISRGLADLLQYFLLHAGQVVSRKQICETFWNDHIIDPKGKNLDMHISKLRRLLGPEPEDRPRLLQNVYGVGYRLNLPEKADLEEDTR